ncbi:MAG: glycosyltransferase family 87 protein [Blastocatellia bacterium]
MIETQIPSNTEHPALPAVVTPAALIALGLASAGLYWWGRDLHRFTQWLAAYSWLFIGQLAIYVVACYVVVRGKPTGPGATRTVKLLTFGAVVVFAVVFRVELVAQRPFLSSDIYRYVWDGRVQAAGVNPYRYTPEAEELRELRDDRIFPNITDEDRTWFSAYPPAAQAVFFSVYKLLPSITGFKLAMSAFDLITLILIMLTLTAAGLDPARAIIFAWHPLVVFETAHSGHVESVYIAFIAVALWAWSRGSRVLTGVGLALATAVKFYPALLLPAFIVTSQHDVAGQDSLADGRRNSGRFHARALAKLWSRSNLKMLGAFAATIAAVYLAYVGAGANLFGFLDDYVRGEGFGERGSRYFLLNLFREVIPIPTLAFLIPAALVLLALAVRQMLMTKRDVVDVARGAIVLVGAYLLLTTPRYAWYYVWLLPLLCFAPRVSWLYLTGAASLLYLVWYTPLVYPHIPLWLGAAIYFPTLSLLLLENAKARRARISIRNE